MLYSRIIYIYIYIYIYMKYFCFNIQSDTPQNVYKYERMIAGYYRSRIKLQGSHARRHTMLYRQLRVKDLAKVPTWWLEGFEPATLRMHGIELTTEPPCVSCTYS